MTKASEIRTGQTVRIDYRTRIVRGTVTGVEHRTYGDKKYVQVYYQVPSMGAGQILVPADIEVEIQ